MSTVDKQNREFAEGDIVNLPLDEVGIIEVIEPGILEFNYSCRIIIAKLSDLGGIGLYHEEDLSYVDPNSTNGKKLIDEATNTLKFFNKIKTQQN